MSEAAIPEEVAAKVRAAERWLDKALSARGLHRYYFVTDLPALREQFVAEFELDVSGLHQEWFEWLCFNRFGRPKVEPKLFTRRVS